MKPIVLNNLDLSTLKQNLLSNTIENEYGCLLWKGARSERGYALFYSPGNRPTLVTRILFYLDNNLDVNTNNVCHNCDNRLCINPKHLFLGSIWDNNDDRFQKGRNGINHNSTKTHCKFGHEFSTANTKYRPDGKGRQCRICTRNRDKLRDPITRRVKK